MTQKGQTANTIGNCKTVFQCDPLLKGAIRLNLLTERIDIVRDVGWRRNTSALTDTDIKYLLLYFEENYGLTSEKKIQNALAIVANENCYHPIKDCLNGFFRLLAIKDEWFSDDLKKLDDDKVFTKLQGHWIIEMPEMLAVNGTKKSRAFSD